MNVLNKLKQIVITLAGYPAWCAGFVWGCLRILWRERAGILLLSSIIAVVAAYMTHIVWVVTTLPLPESTAGQGFLALLGIIAFPIGIIHGIFLWFL